MCDTARVASGAERALDRRWTVTTWNLQGAKGVDVASVAAVIAERAPDVVVLQEIRHRDATRLAASSGMEVGWSLKHFPTTSLLPWRAEGMAILTPHRLGVVSCEQISTDRRRRWNWRRRIAQWAVVERDDRSRLRVVNLHLSPHADAGARLAEAERVAEMVAAHDDELPLVVAGDFNDGEDASIVAALPGIEHLAPGFTNSSSAPSQTLDHVLAPADATETSVEVPAGGARWAALSDHLPVTVRFRV